MFSIFYRLWLWTDPFLLKGIIDFYLLDWNPLNQYKQRRQYIMSSIWKDGERKVKSKSQSKFLFSILLDWFPSSTAKRLDKKSIGKFKRVRKSWRLIVKKCKSPQKVSNILENIYFWSTSGCIYNHSQFWSWEPLGSGRCSKEIGQILAQQFKRHWKKHHHSTKSIWNLRRQRTSVH